MILELDLGNTCWKWRLLEENSSRVLERGIAESGQWLSGRFPDSWASKPSRVRIASVVGAQVEQALSASLSGYCSPSIEFARSSAECAGVRNGYVEPVRLGVDRWLMLLAAYREFQEPVLVVSAGSALTIDVVDRAGGHCGGYIIPGPRLMAESLLRDTAGVRFTQRDSFGDLLFGLETDHCVHNGIAVAQVGAVKLAWKRAEAMLEDSLAVVVAGGYGEGLAASLGELGIHRAYLRKELVLDGLRWALP